MGRVTMARSRREEFAAATFESLLDSAAACFFESGFAATSLDCVAQRAQVTKGAIYHHFASKRDLFRAVLERQQSRTAGIIIEAGTTATDVWGGIVAAFDAFLDLLSDPVYQRLYWVEGPAALGFDDWWKCGERYEIEVIRGQIDRAAEAGILLVEDHDMLANVLFGAVAAGALAMARTDNPSVERERFRAVMLTMLAGMLKLDPST
jgi:AcrR family transcriptional regulator